MYMYLYMVNRDTTNNHKQRGNVSLDLTLCNRIGDIGFTDTVIRPFLIWLSKFDITTLIRISSVYAK